MTVSTEADHVRSHQFGSAQISSKTVGGSGYWLISTTSATSLSITTPKADAGTSHRPAPKTLSEQIELMFRAARYEVFEDGVESEFSNSLTAIVERFGELGVLELAGWLNGSQVATSVVAEALRWLGLIRDPKTHAIRRWLLCDSLAASSVLVRDGAIVGLSYLNDPATKNYLKLASSREPSEELCRDITQLLLQLDFPEKGYVLSSEEDPQGTVGSSLSR